VRRATEDLEAYSLYLQGRHYWERRSGFVQRAIACFEQAVTRDPSFALAHAGLADAYVVLGFSGVLAPGVASGKAKPAALRAVQLDEGLAEAHEALSIVHSLFDWDFLAAEREMRRAIDLSPHSGLAHAGLGSQLLNLGRSDEAFAEASRGRDLEPESALVGLYVAAILWTGHRFEDALVECRRVLQLDPGLALGLFVQASNLSELGRHDEAVDAAERAVILSQRQSHCLAGLGRTYVLAGRRDNAATILLELHARSGQGYVPPVHFAWVAAAMGDLDSAFEWLERAYNERSPFLTAAGVSPFFDPLRGDLRFDGLLKKLGLEGVLPASG
jgi:serine/threonine-protein kinase